MTILDFSGQTVDPLQILIERHQETSFQIHKSNAESKIRLGLKEARWWFTS